MGCDITKVAARSFLTRWIKKHALFSIGFCFLRLFWLLDPVKELVAKASLSAAGVTRTSALCRTISFSDELLGRAQRETELPVVFWRVFEHSPSTVHRHVVAAKG